MNAMMTLAQVAGWLPDALPVGDLSTPIFRVHTDTRTLLEGDLFVALTGANFNGNLFLEQARTKGAAAAMSESQDALSACGLPGLVVADSTLALGKLAAAWRSRFSIPLIAVTGSNGKTTVTQMVASILRAAKPQTSLATAGNFNNEIGLPLTLLRLRPGVEIAVLELGMNHPGEIDGLASIARPTVALVNNAQREHMEFMATVEAVAQENGAVFSALVKDGVAVFPADDEFTGLWRQRSNGHKQITFSAQSDAHGADVRCLSAAWRQGAWQMEVSTPAGDVRLTLQIPGVHNVKNALAAISCCLAAGVALTDIAKGLEHFEPVMGRSRAQTIHVDGQQITLVDDTYNANPDSVQAAIDVLSSMPGPRLLILGDMGEVGSQGEYFHAQAGDYAKARGVDELYTLGKLSAATARQFGTGCHLKDMDALSSKVISELARFQSVLVKGSRFMRMERVVQAINARDGALVEDSHAA